MMLSRCPSRPPAHASSEPMLLQWGGHVARAKQARLATSADRGRAFGDALWRPDAAPEGATGWAVDQAL